MVTRGKVCLSWTCKYPNIDCFYTSSRRNYVAVNNLKWTELEITILNWLIAKRVFDDIILFRRQLHANTVSREFFNELMGSNNWEQALCQQFQCINYTNPADIRYYKDEILIEIAALAKQPTWLDKLEALLKGNTQMQMLSKESYSALSASWKGISRHYAKFGWRISSRNMRNLASKVATPPTHPVGHTLFTFPVHWIIVDTVHCWHYSHYCRCLSWCNFNARFKELFSWMKIIESFWELLCVLFRHPA